MGIYISEEKHGLVRFRYGYDGCYGSEEDWIKRWGDVLIVPVEKVFEYMVRIDEWFYELSNSQECCRFEVD